MNEFRVTDQGELVTRPVRWGSSKPSFWFVSACREPRLPAGRGAREFDPDKVRVRWHNQTDDTVAA